MPAPTPTLAPDAPSDDAPSDSARPAVLVLGRITPRMRERLERSFKVLDDAAGHEGDIEGIAAGMGARVDATAIDRHPALRAIGNYGVGYDAVDAAHAAERGVIVTHTPDVLDDEVANTAILLLLAADRRLVEFDAFVREGRWEREGAAPLTRGVRGRAVGIVGLGRIGATIADKLAGAFGARVLYHSRNRKDSPYEYRADLVSMARESDALIVITPGGPETQGLVSREVMAALGPDGTLVNVARGTVVDEEAMIDLLERGELGRAGLDVFRDEPRVPERLRALPNVVLLPHVGSATEETRAAMGDLVCEGLEDVLGGRRPRAPVPEARDLAAKLDGPEGERRGD